jgi:anti-anti-sigma factor
MSAASEPPSGAPFTVDVRREGLVTTVMPAGELDLATADEFEAAAGPVPAGGRCVVDLRGLAFMDSAGLRAIMRLDLQGRTEGWALVVVPGEGMVRRLLEISRIGDRVTVVDDPEDLAV